MLNVLHGYVPVISLLYVLLFVLGGYICYLVGYRRALADFPVEDTPPVGIEIHSDNEWERLDDACKWLETDNYKLSKRLDELERVNTKQVFDERVEHSVPFGQWALDVSERSKTNQARVEELEHTTTRLLVDRACSGSTEEES